MYCRITIEIKRLGGYLMKNVLIIQDISSFGKCSTTVALPILSASGVTGSILPTALLSTHTGPEFPGYTFLDLFDNMKATIKHWKDLGIKFDAVYTGYLGKMAHIDLILEEIPTLMTEDAKWFIDPAFADDGKLYPGFDLEYAKAQLRLVEKADYVLPNLSEACLMLGLDYAKYDSESPQDVRKVLDLLIEAGAKNAIITGIRSGEKIGVTLLDSDNEEYTSLDHYQNQSFHGTGDVFSSVVVGQYMHTQDIRQAIDKAVEFVPQTIIATVEDDHPITYGVHFEKCLHLLVD